MSFPNHPSASFLLRRAYVTLVFRISSSIFGDFTKPSNHINDTSISLQGTSGSAPDLAGDFQRASGSPAHNGQQPDVWVNPMTDPTNAVSSGAPSTHPPSRSNLFRRSRQPSSSSLVMVHKIPKAGHFSTDACMCGAICQRNGIWIPHWVFPSRACHTILKALQDNKSLHTSHLEQSTRM